MGGRSRLNWVLVGLFLSSRLASQREPFGPCWHVLSRPIVLRTCKADFNFDSIGPDRTQLTRPNMGHLPTRWNALAVVLALATMVGCQGLSTGKAASQGTQTTPVGGLTASVAAITFGNVQTGTSQSQSDVLTNTSGSNLTISQAAVTGTGFSTTGLNMPLSLAAGQSVSFNVIFSPTTAGSVTGNLALTNDGTTSTVNIALSATAVAAGNLTTNPTSFSFGSVQVGATSQTQTETLTNTGGENLTITAATIATGFNYTGLSLPVTLAPNQSTTFGVVFAPTAAGASNGTLSITGSESSTTVDVSVSGTGTVPVTPATLTASPTSLSFTGVQEGKTKVLTETVTNIGGTSATISKGTVSGTGFSISGLGTNVALAPGQSTSFSVTFAPQSTGTFSGNVAIASNASNSSLDIGLSGSAIAPSQGTLSAGAVNVGSVTVGTSGTQTGTLTATGASVSVSSVSLGDANGSEFSVSGLSFPVTVTTSQPITFTVTFKPGATGAASASASFSSNATNSPSASALTGTGAAAPVHSVSLTWKASGTAGVTSYNIYRSVYAANACGSYANIGSTTSSSTAYTDSVVADGTTYCYATTSVDPSGESAYSNVIQAVIPAP
jgi:Abnormal spindle-like microcephaly-assoc'd, ASPM-SPD-2-Hydin